MLFREEDEDLEALPFADREEAGRILAGKLLAYSHRRDVIVLGLARGGMLVAAAVAAELHVALDVFLVSKVGTPWEQELAMGALAEGGVEVLDLSLVRLLGISQQEILDAVSVARQELEARKDIYRHDHPPLDLHGKMVILVDDGIATGCSILAAIAEVRRRDAARVVVAVPVAPASGCNAVRMQADEFVSVAEPEMFVAVSRWYRNFAQISEEDVESLLRNAESAMAPAA